MKTNRITLAMKLLVLLMVLGIYGCIPDDADELFPESTEVLESRSSKEANPAAQNRLLASVRQATAKYHQVEAAIADGYLPMGGCVSVPGLGGMGIHYVNNDLVDDELNPLQPEALVYEPLPNGKLKLVTIEYIVDATDFEEEHDVPMFGQIPMDNHLNGPPLGFPHYQLHVWVWKNNPAGMYTPFNPKVSCPQ